MRAGDEHPPGRGGAGLRPRAGRRGAAYRRSSRPWSARCSRIRRPSKAGMQRGDRILTVAGDEVDTWDDLDIAVGTRPTATSADHVRFATASPVSIDRAADRRGQVRDRRHRRAARRRARSSIRDCRATRRSAPGSRPATSCSRSTASGSSSRGIWSRQIVGSTGEQADRSADPAQAASELDLHVTSESSAATGGLIGVYDFGGQRSRSSLGRSRPSG